MARRKGRKSSNFFAYPVQDDTPLGALGEGILVQGALSGLGITKVWVISADLQWSTSNHTPGEGPISVGLASGDLTVGETAEKLDARPTSRSDRIAMERSRRPVRRVGIFPGIAAEETLNDGKSIRTKLGFYLDEGIELNAWARNEDSAQFTTGTLIVVSGMVYMRWM